MNVSAVELLKVYVLLARIYGAMTDGRDVMTTETMAAFASEIHTVLANRKDLVDKAL